MATAKKKVAKKVNAKRGRPPAEVPAAGPTKVRGKKRKATQIVGTPEHDELTMLKIQVQQLKEQKEELTRQFIEMRSRYQAEIAVLQRTIIKNATAEMRSIMAAEKQRG